MKQNKKIRDTPVYIIPKGYDLEDILDFDDEEFDNGDPWIVEEVEIHYER